MRTGEGRSTLLVTGGSGLLGTAVLRAGRSRYARVVGLHHANPIVVEAVESERVDLLEAGAMEAVVERVRPDHVVHCAAATDVDWCEANAGAAHRLNVDVSRRLAAAVAAVGGRLAYISTDAVFDGEGVHAESDPTAPRNVYARTKRAGEIAVLGADPSALVVRTNLFGWGPPGRASLAQWVLSRLESGEDVPGFRDVYFNPLLADDLAELVLDLLDREAEGVLHVAARDGASKYEFARRIALAFGYDPARVRSTSVEDLALKAPRPKDMVLATAAAERALDRRMPSLDEGIERFRALAARRRTGSAVADID